MHLVEKENVSNSGSFDANFSGGLADYRGGIQPGTIDYRGDIQPEVLLVVGAIALIVAFLVFFFVIQRKKGFKGRFANWLREYLNFRSVLVAGIIKVLYVFFAVFLTIMSIIVMFQGKGDDVLPMILTGLGLLVFGNIMLRVILELTMALIMVWENTSDIRLLLVKRNELFKGGDNKLSGTEGSTKEKQPEIKESIAETVVETQQQSVPQQFETTQPEPHQQQAAET